MGAPPTPVLHPAMALASEWLGDNWGNLAVSLVTEGIARDLGLEARADYVAEEVEPALVITYEDPNYAEVSEDVYRVPVTLTFSALLEELVPQSEMTFSGELPFSLMVDVGDRSVESDADFNSAELCVRRVGPSGLDTETCTSVGGDGGS